MTEWDVRTARIEADFPGWHIWRSNAGRWWATRTGPVVRRAELGAARVMTVDADDEDLLRDQLLVQARLDRQAVADSRLPGAGRPPSAVHWRR
jgi:hypothetical protein